MMDRIYFKQFITILLLTSALQQLSAQSVLLRPYYGRKWFSSNKNNISLNNPDPSFSNTINTSRYITGIAAELQYHSHSFEIYFQSQPTLNRFQTVNNNVGGFSYESEGAIIQFQLLYNQYFTKSKKVTKKYTIIPLISIGLGLGDIRPQSVLERDNGYSYQSNGNQFLEVDYKIKRVAPISYSAVFKIGAALKKGDRELLRIQAIANIGLNKVINDEFRYAHTNDKYAVDIFTRGTYYGVQLSVPLYLKRWHKK